VKSRAVVAARRLAHQEWLRDPAVLSSPERAETKAPPDAQVREDDAWISVCDIVVAN
jgi:hypothetical protein